MTADAILTVALDIAFFAVFALTLIDYLRHPDPVRRGVVLVFGSMAIVFAVQVARALLPGLPAALGLASAAALLAQPVLTLWLIRYFRPVSARVLGLATGLYIASTAALILGVAEDRAFLLLILGYFVGIDTLAAALFVLEAGRRAGAARLRLSTAALATALFGGAVLVAGAGAAVGAPGGAAASAASTVARLVALVAAFGYLVAFTPPRQLRQATQQGILFGFIRSLGQLPTGIETRRIWELLASAARETTGGNAAAVVLGADPGDVVATAGAWPTDGAVPAEAVDVIQGSSPARRTIAVPIVLDGRRLGQLLVAMSGLPLFVDDDLELLRLMADRAARTVDREQVLADLRRASSAKSDFLAAMSHELRTPLNAIIGFSELLLTPSPRGNDEATVREYSDHIHESGLHLLDLINDVLDLAKVEAGHVDLRPSRFDLASLVKQTAETMRPLAERKSIALDVTATDRVDVVADPSRMRQVVFNLLSNAVKFTPPNGRVATDVSAGPNEIRLSVSDTGPGIPGADRDRIFEAFQQVHPGDPAQKGTGLGLALTRQLVERHGGTIELEPAPGGGSRFTVVLPLGGLRTRTSEDALPGEPGPADGPLVLVIEDDPRAAELLRVYLSHGDYNVRVAHDGIAGLEQATSLRPSAIVLDILLPDIDGWEILQGLKQSEATRDIPVLVVSVVDDAQLGLALGAVDYFVKPVTRDNLLNALGRLRFTTKARQRSVSVLVIDGDPDAVDRYRSILDPDGFTVAGATTGERGLQMARGDRPDLVILDLMLPDLDGFEVVSRLKEEPETRDIPIWASTRAGLSPDEKARLNGKVLGVVDRGDSALAGLQHWLAQVAAPRDPAS